MQIKDIFTPVYRQEYFEGYADGSNPHNRIKGKKEGSAYTIGFSSGRSDYESMNGQVQHGIPERIVTNKVLDEIVLAGLLGLSADTDGYSAFQLAVMSRWYQSGTEIYEPQQSDYLLDILTKNGISVINTYNGNLEF